jgi:AAA+ ATPase superfamily predicted ATPase
MAQDRDIEALRTFLDGRATRPTLGLLYGRRRIGKSTLLVDEVRQRGGFYFEATRVATAVHLERLGVALGDHLGVGRIELRSWEEALRQLMRLGGDQAIPVVLDEFGYLLEADPSLPSVIASAFGPAGRGDGLVRLVLCGSAIAMMRSLTVGEAALRGRAGLELVMLPDDYRVAATRLPERSGLDVAVCVFAVIGGVVGYATDMVDFDLPDAVDDLDRWIVQRVLSPAATLHHEATTLLAEDPALAGTDPALHHSILGVIASGSVTAGKIASRLGRQVSNLAPALGRLVDTGFVTRHEDPIRKQRPTYALADPYLQFHYAILEPNRSRLRSRDPRAFWRERLIEVFDSQVRGPVFEQQARTFVERFSSDDTVPGARAHVGPSRLVAGGHEWQLDVVVADDHPDPASREVTALGEAKAGEMIGRRHLDRLTDVRSRLGPRAKDARLLLIGSSFDRALEAEVRHRDDVELIDLDRLYRGD